MANPTLYSELNDVLGHYVAGARQGFGPDFIGAYLTGSFALGDADAGSDVDFLIVVRQALTEFQAAEVQAMHRQVFDLPSHWAKHLDGSYFPADLLRRPDPARTSICYFNHGSRHLELSDHDNTLVVRWVTREYGVALAGLPPPHLIDPVDPNELRAEVWTKFEAWGQIVLNDPNHLDNDWIQPYAALSFARMLHTLDTGAVHSKKAAVAWARSHLDPQWTPLLERAWARHADQFLRYHLPPDLTDAFLTRDFIRFALSRTLPF